MHRCQRLWIPALLFLPLAITPAPVPGPILAIQRVDATRAPEIRCYFTLTDGKGNAILGLTKQDVLLTVDGVPQAVAAVDSALSGGESLTVALLFDTSGSMRRALPQAREAAVNFAIRLSQKDLLAVISFSDSVHLELDFTADRSQIEKAIAAIAIASNTALYDAIINALDRLRQTASRRPAILILSDGKDNRSRAVAADVISRARREGVPLFTIGLGTQCDPAVLTKLAQDTGGSFFPAAGAEDLRRLYQQIAVQLSNQYIVSFTPASGSDERWHELELSISDTATAGGGGATSLRTPFFATAGPGVRPERMSGLTERTLKKNLLWAAVIGALIGLFAALALLILLRLLRPDLRLRPLPATAAAITLTLLGAALALWLSLN